MHQRSGGALSGGGDNMAITYRAGGAGGGSGVNGTDNLERRGGVKLEHRASSYGVAGGRVSAGELVARRRVLLCARR